ncbi:MAG: phosphogluconate dehydrogenase (NAD(+)-dependent, decarboxylating) [Spirochaetota bacterium]
MQIGMVGLGRMGMNMARRLLRGGHQVVAYNRSQDKVQQIAGEGAEGAGSVRELVQKLRPPRVVLIMLPAGEVSEQHIAQAATYLSEGDLLIDGGNSYYRDDIRRSQELANLGIHYLDLGVSGGIWGLEVGYCSMVGGDREDFEHIEPLLRALAPEDGYLYCGPAGAGHFVKMVHNGIEYALMEAYGEGFEILEASPYREQLDYARVAGLWNRGSVVRSWLLELLESAFARDPRLEGIAGYVEDSGEGRWTVHQAVDTGVGATSIAHALFKRFDSRKQELFSNKILAALRAEFGGHPVKET